MILYNKNIESINIYRLKNNSDNYRSHGNYYNKIIVNRDEKKGKTIYFFLSLLVSFWVKI